MRTALTVGITKDGKAEIISHPNVSVHEQIRAFNELDSKKGKFESIQLFQSRGKVRSKRFTEKEGGVDFNSAHPVELQQDKKASKKLPDLTPTVGPKGGVNFNSAHPVELQQDKKASKKLEDLNKKFRPEIPKDSKNPGGVNFDSAKPVEEQGHARKSAIKKKSSRSAQAAAKEEVAKGNPDKEAKESLAAADAEKSGEEGDGPTL